MKATMELARRHALQWTQDYGYHAVVPALLVDPGGVPWAWIFLLLLAAEAGKSVPLLLFYGFIVLSAWDHLLFAIAARGGPPLMDKLHKSRPRWHEKFEKVEKVVHDNAIWAIVFGRFLPVVGRWIGIGAGLSDVSWRRFAILDAIGVALTVLGFGVAAHFVGRELIASPWFSQIVLGAFVSGLLLTAAWIGFRWWRKRALTPPENGA